MGRKTNPFLLLPDLSKHRDPLELGRDFVETLDQLPDSMDIDDERELDAIGAGLHNYGWGRD